MNKRRVNSITYGALISALLGAFLLLNRQLAGMFDVYMLWIIPIPVIVYCLKFDVRQGFVMGIAMVLLTFIVATPMTLFYVASSIAAGLIYAHGMNKGYSSMQLIISVIMVSLFMLVVTTVVFSSFFGYSLADDIEFTRQSTEAIIKSMAAVMGDSVLENPLIKLMLSHNFLLYIIMLSSVLTSVLEGILVHLLAILILKRLKMPMPPIRPLSEIRAPLVIRVFVAAVFMLSILNMFQVPFFAKYSQIIMALVPVAYIFCCFYGYLLAVTWINWKMPGRNSRIMLVFIMVALMILFPWFMIVVGSMDMFTNARDAILKGIRYEQNR